MALKLLKIWAAIGCMALAVLGSQPAISQSSDDPYGEIVVLMRTVFANLEADTNYRQGRDAYGMCLKKVAERILPRGELNEFVIRTKFDCAALRSAFVAMTAHLIATMPGPRIPAAGPLAESKVTIDEYRLFDLVRKKTGEL